MTSENPLGVPQELLQRAMEATLRVCAFWSLSGPQQQTLLSAHSSATLRRWKAGNVSGLTEATVEGLTRILEYSRRLADRSQPAEHVGRWIREAIPGEPFYGRCMLDFMLADDSEMHQKLLEYVSGVRFPMGPALLVRTERNFLQAERARPLAASHEHYDRA